MIFMTKPVNGNGLHKKRTLSIVQANNFSRILASKFIFSYFDKLINIFFLICDIRIRNAFIWKPLGLVSGQWLFRNPISIFYAFQSMNDTFYKTMLCFFLFWKDRIDNLNSLDLLITQVELSYSLRHYYADCYHISYIFLTNFYLHRKRQNDQN